MLGRGSLNELDIFPTTQHSSLTKICYIPCRIQQLALTPMAKAMGIRHSPPCGGCGKHTSEGRRLSCLLQAYTESSFVVAKSSHHKGWQFVCAWTCVREVDAVHFSSSVHFQKSKTSRPGRPVRPAQALKVDRNAF